MARTIRILWPSLVALPADRVESTQGAATAATPAAVCVRVNDRTIPKDVEVPAAPATNNGGATPL